MAISGVMSNHFKYMLLKSIESDTLKIILMDSTFSFNQDTHATLSDVTSHQLSTAYGYTQNDKTLSSISVTEDDDNNRGTLTCDNPTFTAVDGDIGPFIGACIYNDSSDDDTVVAFVELESAVTISDGYSFQFENISISLEDID